MPINIGRQIDGIFVEAQAIDKEEDALYGLNQDVQSAGRPIDETDVDATAMLMKENYIAPGNNIQLATEHQVIVGYGIYQKCTDYHLLRPMREEIKAMMGKYPKIMIQDAGYGTNENTKYLKRERQKFLTPYGMYNQDRGKRNRGEYQ